MGKYISRLCALPNRALLGRDDVGNKAYLAQPTSLLGKAEPHKPLLSFL